LADTPQGDAEILTYAVLHGKSAPESGVLIGRLLSTGEHFVAQTPSDPQTLERLETMEALGRRGTVSQVDGKNVFVPRWA